MLVSTLSSGMLYFDGISRLEFFHATKDTDGRAEALPPCSFDLARFIRYLPPRRASNSLRTFCMADWPPCIMYWRGVEPWNMRLLLDNCTHRSANASPWTMFRAL